MLDCTLVAPLPDQLSISRSHSDGGRVLCVSQKEEVLPRGKNPLLPRPRDAWIISGLIQGANLRLILQLHGVVYY